jgi:hypothetical protein
VQHVTRDVFAVWHAGDADNAAAASEAEQDRLSVCSGELAARVLGSCTHDLGGVSCLQPIQEDDEQAVSQTQPRITAPARGNMYFTVAANSECWHETSLVAMTAEVMVQQLHTMQLVVASQHRMT